MKTIFAVLTLALATVAGTAVAAPEHPATTTAPAANQQLPNKGKVLEVVDTAMYTYIQVSSDKSSVWIAASKIKVAKGDMLSYSNGAVMTNFHSKTLNRTFDSIIFVDKAVASKK